MTATVVSLAAFRNERRAQAEIDRRATTEAAQVIARINSLADQLGGGVLGDMLAGAIVSAEAQAKAAETPKFVPAYCDPNNEVRGAKHDATRSLDIAQIAALVRKDIADTQKRGDLPKAMKASVRIQRYSGGQSLDVRVTALPADFPMFSPTFLEHARAGGNRNDFTGYWADVQSDEVKDLISKLQAIRGAYNRDNSDSMTDYFDYRFGGNAEIDWRFRDTAEAAHLAREGVAQ